MTYYEFCCKTLNNDRFYKYYDLKSFFDYDFGLPIDTPLNAFVGSRDLAGTALTIEELLLNDASYNIADAEYCVNELLNTSNSISFDDMIKNKYVDLHFKSLTLLNRIEISSKNGFISLFNFIESFLSSLGINYILSSKLLNTHTDQYITNYLANGCIITKKKHTSYISIINKMAVYPLFINNKVKNKYDTEVFDINNISSTFSALPLITRFNDLYKLRCSLVHYIESSPTFNTNTKITSIYKSHLDWFRIARMSLRTISNVAVYLWNSCGYLNNPSYIELDYKKFYKEQKQMINDYYKFSKLNLKALIRQ